MSKIRQKYYHFQDRLNFRFKMYISIDEYRNLCKRDDFTIISKDDRKMEIEIYFKGVKLNCYKDIEVKGGRLTTVFKPGAAY